MRDGKFLFLQAKKKKKDIAILLEMINSSS